MRLPGPADAEAAGVPDEALMPLVVASADVEGVDLTVTRGGVVRGKVVDAAGHPIANAVLRARAPACGRRSAPTSPRPTSDGSVRAAAAGRRLPARGRPSAVRRGRGRGRAAVIEPGEVVTRDGHADRGLRDHRPRRRARTAAPRATARSRSSGARARASSRRRGGSSPTARSAGRRPRRSRSRCARGRGSRRRRRRRASPAATARASTTWCSRCRTAARTWTVCSSIGRARR